jgi:hypothetical protein
MLMLVGMGSVFSDALHYTYIWLIWVIWGIEKRRLRLPCHVMDESSSVPCIWLNM